MQAKEEGIHGEMEVSQEIVVIEEGLINSTTDDSGPDIEELSYANAISTIAQFSAPFTLSRVAVAVNVIANGLVIPHLGANAASAGPVMISGVYAIIAPSRSILLSTGILIGKLNGQAKEYTKSGDLEQARVLHEEIGQLVRESMALGVLLVIPSSALMLSMKQILQLTGISTAIAVEAQGFLTGSALGLLPMYWSTSDQQFAFATGRTNIPLIAGGVFSGLSMMLGYPLALGSFGLPKLGPAGMGYGMSAAAWLSFIGLRAYFLREEFAPYKLYSVQESGYFANLTDFLKLGLPMGAQALSEWGNLTVLSTLIGLNNPQAAIAAMGSFEIISAVSLISAAWGQAASVKVSHVLGEMSVLEKRGYIKGMRILESNLKRLANSGIITGAALNVILSVLMIALPTQISSIFIDPANLHDAALLALAKAMLYTNAVGLVFDTVRTIGAGALAGSKDVIFAPVISFITMSLLGLGVGGALTQAAGFDANWLFITRNAGIFLAAAGVTGRLWLKSYLPPEEKQELIEEQVEEQANENTEKSSLVPFVGRNTSSFFGSKPVVDVEDEAVKQSRCCVLF